MEFSMENNIGYLSKIKSTFESLKTVDHFDEMIAQSIRLENHQGYLICVCKLHESDLELIATLADWRKNATTFHNKFNVSVEGTKIWMRNLLLDVPGRILFLVLNRYGNYL